MPLLLILVGLIAMVLSNSATSAILSQIDPDPSHHGVLLNAVAGTGIVPSWISLVHVLGLLSTVIGVLCLFAH